MFRRTLRFLSLSTLLVAPVCAQFGVGNRKQKDTKFQELQELAKKQNAAGGMGGGSMADMQKMMADAMNDPDAMEAMKQYGEQFGDALEQMMKMSPEELQKQMEEALKMMTDGDMVDTILSQKDEVLKSLEQSGTVPADELAKYKADPAYFELKMRESFDQMKDIFSNPEYVAKAADAMKNMQGLLSDPSKIGDLTKMIGEEWQSDEKIEEARLQFLSGDFSQVPGFKEIFETEEMQEILKDPSKWKETVKEGLEDIMNMGAGLGAGAGVKDEL